MDFIILFGKFYLYKCALQEVMPNSECFLKQVEYRKYYEELVSCRNNREEKFQLKWFPYNQIFAFENDSWNEKRKEQKEREDKKYGKRKEQMFILIIS